MCFLFRVPQNPTSPQVWLSLIHLVYMQTYTMHSCLSRSWFFFFCRFQSAEGEAGAGGVLLPLWQCHVHGQRAAGRSQSRRSAAQFQRCQGTIDYPAGLKPQPPKIVFNRALIVFILPPAFCCGVRSRDARPEDAVSSLFRGAGAQSMQYKKKKYVF